MSREEIRKELSQYSSRMRAVEIISLIIFMYMWVTLITKAWQFDSTYKWIFFLSILVGMVAADAASGVVHWAADTWGSVRWPLIGPTLIRGFREHHLDQKAITHHDFIEANGATALVIIPWLLLCWYYVPANVFLFFVWNSFLWLCAWALMTNQFHKWSHLDQVPGFIQLLQKYRLIISVEHHKNHHSGDHTSHYCITTGWLNPVAEKIYFFRGLEKIITWVSGAAPRSDEKRIGLQSASSS